MLPTLLAYSTVDGQTFLIAKRLQQVLTDRGLQVELVSVAQANSLDMTAYGALVLGASVRYGKFQPEVLRFIQKNRQAIEAMRSIFFSVSAVARKPEKRSLQTNAYVKRLLKSAAWQPQHVAFFAGKIDYPRYGFFDRHIIRLIMKLTGGPTDTRTTVEFTDWEQVVAFGHCIADAIVRDAAHGKS